MCSQSLASKKCTNILNGERCKSGWHLKGTVPDNSNSGANINTGSDFQNQPSGSQSQDFLSSMVRREMGIMLREIFQNPPPSPQVRNQSSRYYLWALMGNRQM